MAESKQRRSDKKRKSSAAAPDGTTYGLLANGHDSNSGATSVWPHNSFWPKRRRKQTISVAIAASVIDVAQTLELATFLAGQIARTAAIFNVDEVVVIDDSENSGVDSKVGESAAFLARVLQFMETPQYLRKALIPMHKSLRVAGLLAPLDAPHHVRATEWCPYREAVVLASSPDSGSVCDVGLSQHAVISDAVPEGQRVTLELGEAATAASIPADLARQANISEAAEGLQGRLVDPLQPRRRKGVYWGYSIRIARGLHAALAECPYEGGYDLKVGTSERGSVEGAEALRLPPFNHAIIVLGGPQGLEQCFALDPHVNDAADSDVPGVFSKDQSKDVASLFDAWLNTCPGQGSRTIRTEEALLISMSYLQPALMACSLRTK